METLSWWVLWLPEGERSACKIMSGYQVSDFCPSGWRGRLFNFDLKWPLGEKSHKTLRHAHRGYTHHPLIFSIFCKSVKQTGQIQTDTKTEESFTPIQEVICESTVYCARWQNIIIKGENVGRKRIPYFPKCPYWQRLVKEHEIQGIKGA